MDVALFAEHLEKAAPAWSAVVRVCRSCGAKHFAVRPSGEVPGACPTECGGVTEAIGTLGEPNAPYVLAAWEITRHCGEIIAGRRPE